jgi:hypothetical protein
LKIEAAQRPAFASRTDQGFLGFASIADSPSVDAYPGR